MIDPLPVDTAPDDALTPSFEELFRAHHRDVLRYASLMLGDPDDGADLASDVFAKAFDVAPPPAHPLAAASGQPRRAGRRVAAGRAVSREAASA